MILYDNGDWHVGVLCHIRGSTLPRSACYAFISTLLGLAVRIFLVEREVGEVGLEDWRSASVGDANVWSMISLMLVVLITFRTGVAYRRFWEGTTLVMQMRAEWFDSCANLVAFSRSTLDAAKLKGGDSCDTEGKVLDFQHTLARLMSLMHGAALRQVGGNRQEFQVLDIQGVDQDSLEYLPICDRSGINRVEVILFWIQRLVTDGLMTGSISIPPPILSRVYQTLSRGMVNLHNARKFVDVPMPFPVVQTLVCLLVIYTMLHPIFVAYRVDSYSWLVFATFVPVLGMWAVTLCASELEDPYGDDANDLPLFELQRDMNQSIIMLLDPRSQRIPKLNPEAQRSFQMEDDGGIARVSSTTDLGLNKARHSLMSTSSKPLSMRIGSVDCAYLDAHLRQVSNSSDATPDETGNNARQGELLSPTPSILEEADEADSPAQAIGVTQPSEEYLQLSSAGSRQARQHARVHAPSDTAAARAEMPSVHRAGASQQGHSGTTAGQHKGLYTPSTEAARGVEAVRPVALEPVEVDSCSLELRAPCIEEGALGSAGFAQRLVLSARHQYL